MAGEQAMKTLTPWTSRVQDYITHRRDLGYSLAADASQLLNFARFADRIGQQRLTVALAVKWAMASKKVTAITRTRRIVVVRGFAKYWHRFDPSTEIAPIGLFGPIGRRLTPHIYTEDEIVAILCATSRLRPLKGLRPITCYTVFGLLASTGLRLAEAINLTRADVNFDSGVINIRDAKFRKQRLIPLHPTVVDQLKTYAKKRDEFASKPATNNFFLMDNGKSASLDAINQALRTVCNRLGWNPRGDHARHRAHDFRHYFIVRNLLNWQRQGIDPDRRILALSTYVGHGSLASTYWYVTGVPELLANAAERVRSDGGLK
jgi:integrase